MVSASRSPPGLDPKKVLLEFFFTLGASFGALFRNRGFLEVVVGLFCDFGRTLGALGPAFSSQKRFGPPNAPQEAKPTKYSIFGHTFGRVFFVILLFFHVCWRVLSDSKYCKMAD